MLFIPLYSLPTDTSVMRKLDKKHFSTNHNEDLSIGSKARDKGFATISFHWTPYGAAALVLGILESVASSLL